MASQNKKRSSTAEALDRACQNYALRVACILIVGHEQFASKANLLHLAGASELEADQPDVARSILDQVSKPEAHLGKTDGASRLLDLVMCGLITADDARWLRYVARLLAREGSNVHLDPIYEAARRVVVVHLESEAWR